MVTKEMVEQSLRTVIDPELGIDIVSMGLLYDVTISDTGAVRVLMTLTSMGCPLFDTIADDVKRAVLAVTGVTSVDIDLTFEPPWNPDKMSVEGKEKLGLL